MSRKEVLQQIDAIYEEFCQGCFIHRQFMKEGKKLKAQNFCVKSCTVGQQMKQLGEQLLQRKT